MHPILRLARSALALCVGSFMLTGASAATEDDVQTGGVKMIPIQTPKGEFLTALDV